MSLTGNGNWLPFEYLHVYQPTPQADALVSQWWWKMQQDGDLPALFGASHQGLSGLFRLITPPQAMVYALDDQRRIWLAAWFEEVLGAAFMGLWLAKEHRKSRVGLRGILRCMEMGLREKPVIFGVTKQERIVDEHVRLGYALLGRVPELWGPETDGWLLMLTRDAFRHTLRKYRMDSPLLEEVRV